MLLPTYDIYEEYRYFEPSAQQSPIVFKGLKIRHSRLRGYVES